MSVQLQFSRRLLRPIAAVALGAALLTTAACGGSSNTAGSTTAAAGSAASSSAAATGQASGAAGSGTASGSASAVASLAPNAGAGVKIGLVTKTDSNPYFVKLRESAKAEAEAHGAELIALAGKFDGDNEGQVAAIENLVSQGVKGILITPNSSTGVLGAVKKARDKGIVVI